MMDCIFHNYELPDAQGKRRVRCQRCGWISPPVATRLEQIRANCQAWPFGWELGYWAAIFLAAAGITKGRLNWLRAKLGYDTPCQCDEREQAANNCGANVARWLTSIRRRWLPDSFSPAV